MLMPFLFQSCKDKVDAESPRVIISSPYENETFSTVDTLDVIVKITDNEQIKSLSISLLDENYNALGVETTYPGSGTDINFGTDFILDQPFFNSGTYYLAVRANDGENIGSGYVQIQLTAIERVIDNYLVVTKNASQVQVYLGNGMDNLQAAISYAVDLRGVAFNYRQNILGLAGGTLGDAVFYDMEEIEVLQTIPGFGGNSIPYFVGLDYSNKTERFYVSQRDGQIKVLDKNALQISAAQLMPNTFAEKVYAYDDSIFAIQKAISSNTRVLSKFSQSGALLNSYSISGPVRELSKKSQEETFLWINRPEGTAMGIVNNINGAITYPYTRPDEPLGSAVEIANGIFAISTSTGLYRYAYSNGGTAVLNASLVNLTALYYDDLNGFIYGSKGNMLYQISTTGVLVNTFSFSDDVVYFGVDYNR